MGNSGLTKKLSIIITLGFLGIGSVFIGRKIYNGFIYNRFYSLTMKQANTDKCGLVPNTQEMALLYQKINKPFNPKNPEKLTILEMRDYLKGERIKVNKYGCVIND